jgi:hypothetical protein
MMKEQAQIPIMLIHGITKDEPKIGFKLLVLMR